MVVGVGVVRAGATEQDPADNTCISQSSGTLSSSAYSLALGQSATLSWSLHPGPSCPMAPYLIFYDAITGHAFVQSVGTSIGAAATGSSTVTPQANGHYQLEVLSRGNFYTMASTAAVSVALPVLNGRPSAVITRGGDQVALFAQGVATPNAVVTIRGDVELDLSGRSLRVASGVQIIGQRDAAHPSGPRLFTTATSRSEMLDVGDGGAVSDNVRITGIRFDGGESSDPCDQAGRTDDVDGIRVWSGRGVEIDHSEFYHFSGSAVQVFDPLDRVSRYDSGLAPLTTWVHDNYIHDNQHPTYCGWDPFGSGHGGGYGVSVNRGGAPKIEHNVFGDNRHAIAANGSAGDAYYLVGNLFLAPGVDNVKLVVTNFNHHIDVHGQDTCPGTFTTEHYNCGDAGEYFYVGQNTVVGKRDQPSIADAIQLRGKPTSYRAPGTDGMQVQGNVFAQPQSRALTQTQEGLVDAGQNTFLADLRSFWDTSANAPCDFDGDQVNDPFRASGASWWYHSTRAHRWVALGTTSATSVTFSDVNHDGLCDVTGGSGPRQTWPLFETFPTLATTVPNLIGATRGPAAASLVSAGLVLGTVSTAANAAAVGTIIATTPAARTTAQLGTPVDIVVSSGPPPNVRVPNLVGGDERSARASLRAFGLVLESVSRNNYVDVTAGIVAAQNPPAGAMVPPGSDVGIAVSLGPETGGGGGCFAGFVC